MTEDEIIQAFDEASDQEYLEFERIHTKERKHPRPDICAFLYLHELFGGENRDVISAAEHDQIYLDYSINDLKNITRENVVYLLRCGVQLGNDGLWMFA